MVAGQLNMQAGDQILLMPLPHDLLQERRRADPYPVLQLRRRKHIVPKRPDAIFRRRYIEIAASICAEHHNLSYIDESRRLFFARYENTGRQGFVCELQCQKISYGCIKHRFRNITPLNQLHAKRRSVASSSTICPKQRLSRYAALFQSG